MKDFLITISFIIAFALTVATAVWIMLFSFIIIKNTIAVNIPNALFLADCYSAKTQDRRERSCEMAWGKYE
jgi:5-bromo-4-chloroindolyl phosphate hydrolysis protein